MSPKIVAGKYKGRNLKNISGKSVRPISGMIKEALFSILSVKIKDAILLDVFAGTGSVGIEALSRGSRKVIFIEKSPKMTDMLNRNLEFVDSDDDYKIVQTDFFNYDFSDFDKSPDIVFAGPPYKQNLSNKILKYTAPFIDGNTLLIIQHYHDEKAENENFKKIDSRKYGISRLDFFKKID